MVWMTLFAAGCVAFAILGSQKREILSQKKSAGFAGPCSWW
jgi:hypothetical protein